MLYSLLPLLLLLLLVALVAVMFRMLFYRLSHTHTHTEQARRQAADSGQRTVESRVSPLLAMDCPGAMQSCQGCPELLHTHEHMQVCLCVCVSPRGSCMQSHVCCFLVASFCRHFARWLAAIFIARQLWTSSVLQMISIPG